jgi:predicted ArsR family transcriptional regulator
MGRPERLNLHPNGVRIHLERMERAGLVQRAQVRRHRGRPPNAWRIDPDQAGCAIEVRGLDPVPLP